MPIAARPPSSPPALLQAAVCPPARGRRERSALMHHLTGLPVRVGSRSSVFRLPRAGRSKPRPALIMRIAVRARPSTCPRELRLVCASFCTSWCLSCPRLRAVTRPGCLRAHSPCTCLRPAAAAGVLRCTTTAPSGESLCQSCHRSGHPPLIAVTPGWTARTASQRSRHRATLLVDRLCPTAAGRRGGRDRH